MFEYSKFFTSIAFHSDKIKNHNDILALFPNADILKVDNIYTNSSKFDGSHYIYFSKSIYTRSNYIFDDNCSEVRNGIKFFKYHIYIFNVTKIKEKIYFIALPFINLAIFLFQQLREKSRGMGFNYQIINVEKLVDAVKNNNNLSGALKISKLKYTIYGDGLADSIVLAGSDILHSIVFGNTIKPLEDKGLKLFPERMRILFQEVSNNIICDVDKFGNYRFYIRKEAINLPLFSILMDYFYENGLINSTTAFPFLKYLKEDEF